jgi:hypothetical protein
MKFLFSFLFLLFAFIGSSSTVEQVQNNKYSVEISSTVEFNDRGKKAQRKKARRGQKMNKKRKKACNSWGKRSFAG